MVHWGDREELMKPIWYVLFEEGYPGGPRANAGKKIKQEYEAVDYVNRQ